MPQRSDCIAQDVKIGCSIPLFLISFKGIVDGHHIIGNDTRRPKLRGFNGKTIDTPEVKNVDKPDSLERQATWYWILDANQLVHKTKPLSIESGSPRLPIIKHVA